MSSCTSSIGLQGPRGTSHANILVYGDTGQNGHTGQVGIQGNTGQQGLRGVIGQKGETGDIGLLGQKGDTGRQGIKGIIGEQGRQGNTGQQGQQGQQGIPGFIGQTGDTGPIGQQGIIGQPGIKGMTGQVGMTGGPVKFIRYAPSITEIINAGSLGLINTGSLGFGGYPGGVEITEGIQGNMFTADTPMYIFKIYCSYQVDITLRNDAQLPARGCAFSIVNGASVLYHTGVLTNIMPGDNYFMSNVNITVNIGDVITVNYVIPNSSFGISDGDYDFICRNMAITLVYV